jgi:hypothetical protein
MDSTQVSQSEDPVKKLREEFNQQRARMKELYLQKEGFVIVQSFSKKKKN